MEQTTLMTDTAATPTDGSAASQGTEQQNTQADASQGPAEQGQQQQSAEQGAKTEGEAQGQQAADAQKQEGEAKDKPEGAPEKYEFKPLEGVEFDDQVVGAFADIAKELNMSQEAAQKVLDKVGPVMAARQAEALQTVRNEWAEAAKIDKEFGGDKLDANLAVAKKAMDAFASPELRAMLNESGLGNHPEIIRMMYRAGKAISEDSLVTGGNARSSDQTTAQRMYPNMNP